MGFFDRVKAVKEKLETAKHGLDTYRQKRWENQRQMAAAESGKLRAEAEREELKARISRAKGKQTAYKQNQMAGFNAIAPTRKGKPQKREDPFAKFNDMRF